MSLEEDGLVRVGELELRDHAGHWSMEFKSPEEMQDYLTARDIEHWVVCDRKV